MRNPTQMPLWTLISIQPSDTSGQCVHNPPAVLDRLLVEPCGMAMSVCVMEQTGWDSLQANGYKASSHFYSLPKCLVRSVPCNPQVKSTSK